MKPWKISVSRYDLTSQIPLSFLNTAVRIQIVTNKTNSVYLSMLQAIRVAVRYKARNVLARSKHYESVFEFHSICVALVPCEGLSPAQGIIPTV